MKQALTDPALFTKQKSGTSGHREADRPLSALFWMSLSALGFSLMGVFVKHLSPKIPVYQLVFFRSSVNLAVVTVVMAVQKQNFFPGEKKILFVRGLFGFGSLSCFFYSISHLPLAVAIMVAWCAPIFVFIFSWAYLGESIRFAAFRWVGLAFVGFYMIMKPDFTHGVASTLSLTAMGVGLLGSALGGMAYVAVRAATARVGVQVIIFHFVAIATLISAPLAVLNWVSLGLRDWLELIAMGLCASFGQHMMTHGYRFAAAGVVSTMGLVGVVFSATFGWILFDEGLEVLQGAGMVVLAAGIVMLALTSQRLSGLSKTR